MDLFTVIITKLGEGVGHQIDLAIAKRKQPEPEPEPEPEPLTFVDAFIMFFTSIGSIGFILILIVCWAFMESPNIGYGISIFVGICGIIGSISSKSIGGFLGTILAFAGLMLLSSLFG
jgi:hypothetical protein